jgi:hypothetical protein
MYFGRPSTDPALPDAIIEQLTQAYRDAVTDATVTAFTLTATSDLGFTLDVTGHELPTSPETTDPFTLLSARLTGQTAMADPLLHVALTAAMCARVTATLYTRGHACTRQFAHATALGPVLDAGRTDHGDGYMLTFDLDAALMADGARLTQYA